MRNTLQHQKWISRILLGAASAEFTLAGALTLAVMMTQLAEAQTVKVLHRFNTADGPQPARAGLIQATNGELYGTTQYGGLFNDGSVFKMTLGGTLTTVYSFCPPGSAGNCVDAFDPQGLVLGTNGKIYGTTQDGGGESVGTIFEMTAGGAMTALSGFCALNTDPTGIQVNACGAYPVGSLVQGRNGIFWGIAQGGGTLGQGAKFEITPSGQFGSVTSFACIQANCNQADFLVAGLIQGTDGNFYGTTEEGGTGAFGGGLSGGQFGGSVFKITPTGALTTLYSFCSLSVCADGQGPMGALVEGADGNFYGTTFAGGVGTACNPENGVLGCGTVFQITPGGTLRTLYSFCKESGCLDGQNPVAGLILGTDGNLYGTTQNGGVAPSSNCSDNPCGTIFEITPGGTLTTLYSFCNNRVGIGCLSGGGPVAPLLQDTNGDFYGTTLFAGSEGSFNGTIFRLSTALGLFVKTLPTAGLVGEAVKILGTDLTGATSVSFDGTAAVFTVVSGAEITTTVPAGATTGTVQVVTPSGILSSNVTFQVLP